MQYHVPALHCHGYNNKFRAALGLSYAAFDATSEVGYSLTYYFKKYDRTALEVRVQTGKLAPN